MTKLHVFNHNHNYINVGSISGRNLSGTKLIESALLVTRSDDGYVAITLRVMSRADGTHNPQPQVVRISRPE